jgi:flagellar basal-body rod protein FlgC
MFDAQDVLAAGMSAMRLRVNTIASNIANAETTRTPDGGPYKRKDVVMTATTTPSSFQSALDEMTLSKPGVAAVVEDQQDPRKVYQPGHPDADKEGYVSYPNINVVQSMTDLMTATRLYQANVAASRSIVEMGREARKISSSF